MKTVDRKAELQAAIDCVERVLEDLHVEYSQCGECGMKHYDNFHDWQAFTRLESVVQSLQKQISVIAAIPQSRGNGENDNGTQGQSSGSRR